MPSAAMAMAVVFESEPTPGAKPQPPFEFWLFKINCREALIALSPALADLNARIPKISSLSKLGSPICEPSNMDSSLAIKFSLPKLVGFSPIAVMAKIRFS